MTQGVQPLNTLPSCLTLQGRAVASLASRLALNLPNILNEEAHYTILRLLEQNPKASQRDMAKELGVSLGKVNYCLQALIEKGLVKAGNFRKAEKKTPYLYKLTPKGIKAKTSLAVKYLQRKTTEYDALRIEIENLRKELEGSGG
jgi:MarR family transcriptional regulator, temperature-dependent positive regulator of motility